MNRRATDSGSTNGRSFRPRNAGGFGKNSRNGTDCHPRIERGFVEDSVPNNEFRYR